MAIQRHEYSNLQALDVGLANWVAQGLKTQIVDNGRATLAVSGGSTPMGFLQKLSQAEIDWQSVDIILVDERWVDEHNERSNARMVKACLLQNQAAKARFHPMYNGVDRPEDAVAGLEILYRALPIDVIVLGMGLDGHTASLFANSENFQAAIDLANSSTIIAMPLPGEDVARMSLTLSAIASAKNMAIHITGNDKLAVFAGAVDGANELPISTVLQNTPRVDLFWSAQDISSKRDLS